MQWAMQWVSILEGEPEDGQAVLVRYNRDNWWSDHTLADGSRHQNWRWMAAKFVRVGHPEVNNKRPYIWRAFGPGDLFGQDVSHWAAIIDPLESQHDGT